MFRACLISCIIACSAQADVIYETEDPFGGFFGLWGADVFERQSVGLRFTPAADYRLDRISLWFMNNDGSGQNHDVVTIWLVNDDNDGNVSIPGMLIYDEAAFATSAVGWDPQLESVTTENHPLLRAGHNYWVVCRSDAVAALDPVWNFASEGTGFSAFTNGDQDTWQPGGSGAGLTAIIEGTPVSCIADFNLDGTLNSLDFLAFLNAFSAGDPSADFNGDGTVNTLDFLAFLNAFNAGC